jgi:hypothetical protein
MNSPNISIEYLPSDGEQVILSIYFFNFSRFYNSRIVINFIFILYDINYVVSDAQRAVSNI